MGKDFVKRKRHQVKVVVFMILMRKNGSRKEVLLQERRDTGYMDGMFDFAASGHMEADEYSWQGAIREAGEEIGVTVAKEDVEFVFLDERLDEKYIKLFFMTDKWSGEPKIREPQKCSWLEWFDVEHLPENMIPSYKKILEAIMRGERIGAF